MKRFITAALAACSIALPATATVQPGTLSLIKTVAGSLNVVMNDTSCTPGMAGSYQLLTKTLTLCPGSDVDADDHDTVRHEVWHAVQHCLTEDINKGLEPVVTKNTDDWWDLIGSNLSLKTAAWIHESYPKSHWDVEYEAFVMASTLTSAQIEEMFIRSCVD